MYQTERNAKAMRWHAEHQSEEGSMVHPSDAGEWKQFQHKHSSFAAEARNVYLGLCTDGFNPFGMSKNHSLWPVILTPYNLPPDMCMSEEFLWLTILNSGPKHPRASLDVFLRPLIDELKELWCTSVEAYDISTKQNFTARAVLMWTISDFPAYSMLSGWTTHGRLACPVCMEDTTAFQLPNGRKTCWFDCHRRYLPQGHAMRKSKTQFLKGKHAMNARPHETLTGAQVYDERILQVNPRRTAVVGGNGHEVKKAGYGKDHNWHKESIFWELSYWRDLDLRHNLDVMHIEKNFFDNILHTVMNDVKSKDTENSRKDLALFCSRKELHLDSRGKAPIPIFRLGEVAKTRLLECVKNEVRFPDGYASNIAGCVDLDGRKFSGMKSHDCHVFMERLLPFIFAELLPRNVHLALSGIGSFFRDLCSRSLNVNRVQIMKENIVIILCNLEKIFPPSFFDAMEHVTVHLPYEAELGGPVQYIWMYPFERFFKKLKSKAKNKRYAAGSIVQSYLNDEISYFSEQYFSSNIQTKSRLTRFDEGEAPVYPVGGIPDIFCMVGRGSGRCKEFFVCEADYHCAHAYVLRNCDYFRPLEGMFEAQIRYMYPTLSEDEVCTKRDANFPEWLRQYVLTRIGTNEEFPIWVQELVQGPKNKVMTWPRYHTRGYLFHTQSHGRQKKTYNYGICVKGENYADTSDEADFYGNITDIMQFEYGGIVNLQITLFKCKWYDPTPGRGTRKSDGGIIDVLASGKYNKYEPFILASQGDQVCYVPYPSTKHQKKSWLNVMKVTPRANILGAYTDVLPPLLQQDTDVDVERNMIEEVVVDNLADGSGNAEDIRGNLEDVEPEDEFRCNLSSDDDDDDYEDIV